MQRVNGLTELLALQVIRLRNEDTCVWVMRETKKFLVDNLVHHPEIKLEWISIDEDCTAERITRTKVEPEKKVKKPKKEKVYHPPPPGKGKGAKPGSATDAAAAHSEAEAAKQVVHSDAEVDNQIPAPAASL